MHFAHGQHTVSPGPMATLDIGLSQALRQMAKKLEEEK